MLSLEWHVVMCVPGVERIVANSTVFSYAKGFTFIKAPMDVCMYIHVNGYINNYGIYYEVEVCSFSPCSNVFRLTQST